MAPTASVAVRTLNMVLLVVAETRMLGEMGKRKVWGRGVSNACGQDVFEPVLKTIKLTNMHELIPIALVISASLQRRFRPASTTPYVNQTPLVYAYQLNAVMAHCGRPTSLAIAS